MERIRLDKIDHIGIAVKSLSEAIPIWTILLGQNPSGEEDVPSEGVRVALFGEGTGRIELLEPTAPDSAIARHIDKRGAGIHHVCFRVPDLDAALTGAEQAGLETIPPRIRDGSGGHRVAFLHPRSAGGVLIELAEAGGRR